MEQPNQATSSHPHQALMDRRKSWGLDYVPLAMAGDTSDSPRENETSAVITIDDPMWWQLAQTLEAARKCAWEALTDYWVYDDLPFARAEGDKLDPARLATLIEHWRQVADSQAKVMDLINPRRDLSDEDLF